MHYLITGHTGFKGSWLTLLLTRMGHTVSGVALDPEPDSLFTQAGVSEFLRRDIRADVRDVGTMPAALDACSPDVLIHMAAQPLVRESYRNPRYTIETNVMGTLNILEAAAQAPSLQAQLIVTTDKVYRNVSRREGYEEDEPLGGDDPYSASKAMADLLTQSWTKSFDGPLTSIARAGNVIGGGDASDERLLPDLVRAFAKGELPELRYPEAVRPWQHVLDCLHGYLTLIDHMLTDPSSVQPASPWNFGPDEASFVTVGDVASRAAKRWGVDGNWTTAPSQGFHEAGLLALDSSKAKEVLGWQNLLSLDASIDWTIDWYRTVDEGASAREVSIEQLAAFEELSRASDGKAP